MGGGGMTEGRHLDLKGGNVDGVGLELRGQGRNVGKAGCGQTPASARSVLGWGAWCVCLLGQAGQG